MTAIFLDVRFAEITPSGQTTAAWIVPISIATNASGSRDISHNCCSRSEIDHVIDQMHKDLEAARKKAHRRFAQSKATADA